MKKLSIVVLALLIVIVAAVFLAPVFIDGNKYKDEVEGDFKEATGYQIAIKGEVKLSFFPQFQARAGNVSIFNGSKNIANIEEITLYPQFKTIFGDKIAINSLKIDKASVTLEKDENGNNWDITTPSRSVANVKKLDVQIKDVQITDSKLDYADKVKKKTYSFSDLDFKNVITSLEGPVSFDGTMKYQDLQIATKGNLQNFADPKISFTTNVLSSEVFYEGTSAGGKFSVKSTDIQPLANFLDLNNWGKQLAKQNIDVAGEVNYSKDKIDLHNLKLDIGSTSGSGDVSSTTGDKLDIVANLKFKTLSLDQLVPTTSAAADEKKDEGEAKKREINAELDIAADTIVFGGAEYKNLNIKSTSENNVISLQPFSIDFPKNGHAEMFGVLSDDSEGRIFDGDIKADSTNLREILKSFKLTPPPLKQGSLESFKLNSHVVVNLREHPSADLSDATLNVDDSLFKGSISLDFNGVTGVSLNGTVDEIDLDKYLVPTVVTAADKQETGPTDDRPFRITWLEKLPLKGTLNVMINKFIYAKEPYNNLRMRVNYKPETLDVDEVSFSGKKVQLTAKGSLYAYPNKKPKANFEANFGKIDLADFMTSDDAKPRPHDKSRWAKDPFNLSFLRKVDVDFAGNVSSLIHNKFVFDNMDVKGYIESGKLVVEKAKGNMYGGKVEISGAVEATAVPSLSLGFSGNGVDANRLLDALADNTRVSGKMNFSGSASSSGIYQLAMISNLKGSVSFLSNNLVIKGFDLDGMAQQITNTNNVADVVSIARTVSGDDAVTYLKNVNGTIVVENGQARHQDKGVEMTAAAGGGLYSGKADFVNWNMDTNADFKLITPDKKQKPELGVHIFGAIDDPDKDINLDAVKRYISGRGAKLLLNQ